MLRRLDPVDRVPGGGLAAPSGLAIDASGNLWVSSMGDNSITQFVGLATAAMTLLVASAR